MFKFTNPHPEQKLVGDCVKRACVIASEINYHDIAIMLNRYRKESGGSKFNSNENWKPFIENVLCGVKDSDDMQHAFEGHRYTVADYAETWVPHRCILRCSKHLVACKYGDYYDTWDSGNKGVYIAYMLPRYEQIVEHIRKHYPKLCKGLTLEKYTGRFRIAL
jgi:hypothetical protein